MVDSFLGAVLSKLQLSAKKRLVIVASTMAGLLSFGATFAANPESVVVQVTFVDPITITEVNALQIGLLDQNLAVSETVVIIPGGGFTDSASRVLGGTQAAANLTVTATAGFAITVDVTEVSEGTGYTLGTYMCNYDAGTDTVCDGAGYSQTSAVSATLLIGATLAGDGLAVAGTADGSFNVTVSYQ